LVEHYKYKLPKKEAKSLIHSSSTTNNNNNSFRSRRNQTTMADSSSNLKSEAIIDLMKQHFSTDAGKKLTEKIGLVYQFQIAPKVFFLILLLLLFLIISFHFSLIPNSYSLFVNFVENWNQWSYIYRWSQERTSHQRLISFSIQFYVELSKLHCSFYSCKL